MKKNKKENKKAGVKTPIEDLNGKSTIEHYNAVLLEHIDSKIDTVIEVVQTTEKRSNKRFDDFRSEVNQRFDLVEAAIKYHSGEIKGLKSDVSELKSDVSELKSDVKELNEKVAKNTEAIQELDVRLSTKIDKNTEAIQELDVRLSTKIDKIAGRLDDHEVRITTLEESRA